MAIVSLIALLAALGLAALISLQPWTTDSVAPQVSVAPGLGVALGDAVEVASGPSFAVAPARAATGGESRFAAGEVAGGEGASRPELRVSAAVVVASPDPGRPPEGSPEPPSSEPLPPPQPAPTPEVVPVAVPTPAPPTEPVVVPPSRPSFGSPPPGPSTSAPRPVEGSPSSPVEVHEGDESAFAFSFSIEPTVYREPGAENLIMQFRSEASDSPSFGLQLWDDGSGSQRGLWASGDAMGGERFLAPVAEGVWHQAVVYFRASSQGDGFYLLILDGQPVDARGWVGLLDPDSGSAQIEVGLFRDGERVVDTPDVRFGPIALADGLESVIP